MSGLLPTQDVDELHHSILEGPENFRCWGRFLPLRSKLPALGNFLKQTLRNPPIIDLVEECYTFGRADNCSFVFTAIMFDDSAHFSTFSKQHFKESTNQGTIPFIQDLSSNGTFVNGAKIGRGKKCPLNNNDEISLSVKHFKCFIFSDSNSVKDQYPIEVTEKYTVSKLLGRGACGEVRLVFERHSCRKYAMKIVQKKTFSISSKLGETFTKRIQSEVDILMRLSHPCVIFIYEVVNVDDALYMILELVEGGELFDRIIRLGHLSETDSKFLFLQMVYAVKVRLVET
ncbi:Mitogen-activated protein kinase [Fasciola gigantica]|uniref:non-specific serine/threonine protein kinase n=1 Tax=Fasciola gigantica TaxID=46835 RepID=A0A504Z7I5_FASGI|nr:Mitogen-activated protein kinase [Fasciola gigantica]